MSPIFSVLSGDQMCWVSTDAARLTWLSQISIPLNFQTHTVRPTARLSDNNKVSCAAETSLSAVSCYQIAYPSSSSSSPILKVRDFLRSRHEAQTSLDLEKH